MATGGKTTSRRPSGEQLDELLREAQRGARQGARVKGKFSSQEREDAEAHAIQRTWERDPAPDDPRRYAFSCARAYLCLELPRRRKRHAELVEELAVIRPGVTQPECDQDEPEPEPEPRRRSPAERREARDKVLPLARSITTLVLGSLKAHAFQPDRMAQIIAGMLGQSFKLPGSYAGELSKRIDQLARGKQRRGPRRRREYEATITIGRGKRARTVRHEELRRAAELADTARAIARAALALAGGPGSSVNALLAAQRAADRRWVQRNARKLQVSDRDPRFKAGRRAK